MKISKLTSQNKTMIRFCAICGKKILVHRLPNRGYMGGNYFGRIGTKEKIEYWECDECYKE